MFPEAVARYHELLANQDIAESSRATLDQGLEQAKLIFGGRRLSPYLRPHFVTETDFARITKICETVWSAIQKVKDAAVEDHSLVDDLGITEIERELVAIDPGYKAVSPTARLDSFLTASRYSFVELNGESPAGIAYADAAYDIFSSLPVMKEFGKHYNVRPLYGRRFMLEVCEFAFPVGAELRAHAPLDEGPAHRRRLALQLLQFDRIFRRQQVGNGRHQLGDLHQRTFEIAERGRQRRGFAGAVGLAAEEAPAAIARGDPSDIGTDAGIARGAGGKAVLLAVRHERRCPFCYSLNTLAGHIGQ